MSAPLVVLAAGGTAGHVFPAEALAAALVARGYHLALVTDHRGAAYGGVLGTIETHRLRVSSLAGGLARRLRGGLDLGLSLFEARRLLRRLGPRAVIGFGGYPSLPTVAAAALARIATAVHEQNAVIGRANRLLAPRVDAIATSFPQVTFLSPRDTRRAVLTGNPVRAAALAARDRPYEAPAPSDRFRLLITGGSQGASVFGAVVPKAVAALPPGLRGRLDITQQCRPDDINSVREAYQGTGIAVELATFFADLPERLAGAQLAICRAGASTTAELAVIGRPAILVPYPHATDDHQTANAQALVAAGAGWRMPQETFTAPALAEMLGALLGDTARLAAAAAAARALGRPDAAERLADLVQRLAPANGARAEAA
jgi:UDP-N-acetylglucosamine--N-acetylmuramyl-(pentapeptide) pyrophosphoryl-undecaprenol N-acetylglucosamine transferase